MIGATPPADLAPRCWRCHSKLSDMVTRPWAIRCTKCHAFNAEKPENIQDDVLSWMQEIMEGLKKKP